MGPNDGVERRIPRLLLGGAFILVLCVVAKFGLGMAAAWFCGYMAAATASGALTGAAAGAVVGRTGANRSLRLQRRDLVRRGVRYGAFAGWGSLGFMCSFANDAPVFGLMFAILMGAMMAIHDAYESGRLLSAAERAFATAAECVRKGDRIGAASALRRYVEHAKDDPAREARLPAAERWLRGETDKLEVFTELQAAEAPGGTGTELSAAERPEGAGNEMVGALETAADVPVRGRASDPPLPVTERPGAQAGDAGGRGHP